MIVLLVLFVGLACGRITDLDQRTGFYTQSNYHIYDGAPARIDSPFPIKFQGKAYQGFWVTTSSEIYFTKPISPVLLEQSRNMPHAAIRIASKNLTGTFVKAQRNSTSITVEFRGVDEDKRLNWVVTFQNTNQDVFVIDIKRNELSGTVSEVRDGFYSFGIQTKAKGVTRYGILLSRQSRNFGSRVARSILTALAIMLVATCLGYGAIRFVFWCYKSPMALFDKSPPKVKKASPYVNKSVLQQNQEPKHAIFPSQEDVLLAAEVCRICLQIDANIETRCKHYFHGLCLREEEGWSHRRCPECKQESIVQFARCAQCDKFSSVVLPNTLLPLRPVICESCQHEKTD